MNDIEALEKLVLDDDFQELSRILKSRPPNIFRILGIEYDEVRWSAFLAWLLDPNEDHGLGDKFLRAFLVDILKDARDEKLRAIDIYLKKLSDVEVRVEEDFGEYGRGDITIRCHEDNLLCIIENKVWSAEGEDQTERYFNAGEEIKVDEGFEKVVCIFLTLDGTLPKKEEFIPYSYRQLVEVLDSTIALGEWIPNQALGLIKQFHQNVREVIGMQDSDEVKELCRKVISKHMPAIEKLYQYWPDRKRFFADLANAIDEKEEIFNVYIGSSWMFLSPKGWIRNTKNNSDLYYLILDYGKNIIFVLEYATGRENIEIPEPLKNCVNKLLEKQEGHFRAKPHPNLDYKLAEEWTKIPVPTNYTNWEHKIEEITKRFLDFLERFPIATLEEVPGVKG